MGLGVIDTDTGEKRFAEAKDLTVGGAKSLDWHSHFDPIQKYGKRFKRLNALEFVTVASSFIDPKTSKAVEIDLIVQLKMTYSIN